MDYEKKYKEALERAREWYNNPNSSSIGKTYLYAVFPELKESEDEKNIKDLIDELKCSLRAANCQNDACGGGHEKRIALLEWAIDWLEKQGEKSQGKTALETWKDMRLEVYQQASGNRHEPNYSDDTTKMFSLNDIDEIMEKISEQKPVDKVKPKFKVGDWVVDENGIVKQILSYKDGIYKHTDGYSAEIFEDEWRMWTIEDAKDGDVLCYKDEISLYKHDIKYCTEQGTAFGGFVYYCCYDGKRFITNSMYSLTEKYKDNIHPATKEQSELLFAKMHEAGYEWDAEKKELKKIEHKITESEDERMRNIAIYACKYMVDNFENSTKQYEDAIAWLEKQGEQMKLLTGLNLYKLF